jgi:hypothetical protein
MGESTSSRRAITGRFLIAVVMLLTIAGPAASAPLATAQQLVDAAPLELPAMVLFPDDLAQAGSPGYKIISSSSVATSRSLARLVNDWTDEMLMERIQETFDGMGFIEGYEFGFRLQQNPDDANSELIGDIYVSLNEFTNATGPADALAFMAGLNTSSNPEVQRIDGSGSVPGALLSLTTHGEGDELSHTLMIIFQTGPVIAAIRIWDDTGQQPTVQEAETLATRQSQKIEEAIQNGTLGLANKVPRLKDAEFHELYEVRGDLYLRKDGVDFPLAFDDPAQVALRAELAGNSTDVYEFIQFIQEEPSDPSLPFQFGWRTRIYRFQDDAAASTWLSEGPNRIAGEYVGSDQTLEGLQILQDSPAFGDESITVTYTGSGVNTSEVSRVFVRVANTVADVRFIASVDMLAATQALAAVQTECLISTCPTPMTIADALSGQVVGTQPAVQTPTPPVEGTAIAGGPTVSDLAAMTLTPGDLAALGLTGYRLDSGLTIYPDAIIENTAANRGLPEAEVRATIEGADLEQRYENYLYLLPEPSDPNAPSTRLIASYVIEFADDAGAAAAWDFMEDESQSPTAQDVPLTAGIGDQAEATLDQGQDAQTGEVFAQLDLTFRIGNLHAGVAIIDWKGQAPVIAEAERLAERLLERIETVRNQTTPGLYDQVTRLSGDDVTTVSDHYILLDHEPVPLYSESEVETMRRDFEATAYGQIDGYSVQQQMARGTEDPGDDTWYIVSLHRFADESTAAEWLASTQQRMAANPAFDNAQFTQDQVFGDESIDYTLSSQDGTVAYRGIVLRVGTIVVSIDVTAPQAPSAAAVESLALAQVNCLNANGCAAPVPVPAELS